jgi:hypothetical protein
MGWSKFHRDFTSIIADAWHVSVVQAATHGFPLHLENNTWRSGTVQAVHVNGGNDTIFRSLTLTLDTGNLGHGTTSTYGNITPVYVVVLAGGLLVLSGPELHTA